MTSTIFNCKIDRVTQVYDGDTIKDVKVEVEVPEIFMGAYRIVDVRVYGIDTPESRPRRKGRTSESIAREKQAAKEARDFVIELLAENNFQFTLSNVKSGKYADRVIGTVLIGDINLAQRLISEGYAYAYFGEKRKDFDEWYQRDKGHWELLT